LPAATNSQSAAISPLTANSSIAATVPMTVILSIAVISPKASISHTHGELSEIAHGKFPRSAHTRVEESEQHEETFQDTPQPSGTEQIIVTESENTDESKLYAGGETSPSQNGDIGGERPEEMYGPGRCYEYGRTDDPIKRTARYCVTEPAKHTAEQSALDPFKAARSPLPTPQTLTGTTDATGGSGISSSIMAEPVPSIQCGTVDWAPKTEYGEDSTLEGGGEFDNSPPDRMTPAPSSPDIDTKHRAPSSPASAYSSRAEGGGEFGDSPPDKMTPAPSSPYIDTVHRAPSPPASAYSSRAEGGGEFGDSPPDTRTPTPSSPYIDTVHRTPSPPASAYSSRAEGGGEVGNSPPDTRTLAPSSQDIDTMHAPSTFASAYNPDIVTYADPEGSYMLCCTASPQGYPVEHDLDPKQPTWTTPQQMTMGKQHGRESHLEALVFIHRAICVPVQSCRIWSRGGKHARIACTDVRLENPPATGPMLFWQNPCANVSRRTHRGAHRRFSGTYASGPVAGIPDNIHLRGFQGLEEY
jgi:hypothetical protein